MASKPSTPRVKFNPETVETSFGGTQLPGRIRETSVLNDDSRLEWTAQTPECFRTVTMETPQSTSRSRRSEILTKTEDSGITVAVRVRPFTEREKSDPGTRCVVSMIDNETVVTTDRGEVHSFCYDYSFWSFDENSFEFASQEHVYQSLAQPMLGKAFEGYNTCLFAYGQTGSGKSYSMMGHKNEAGIIPRFCEELFGRVKLEKLQNQVNVEISYFEIYNEKIHDLLAPSTKHGKKTNLKVREHPTLGPYVEELSSYVVQSFEDIKSWLSVGNKHRATASTWMNDKSSRSHSVFTMILSQNKDDTLDGKVHNHTVTSKINLVDLAGSERQSLAKTSSDRLREGASINKSLMTLGKVISLLSEHSMNVSHKRKRLFIPYRDSVLTWLLKESLGGNSKTAMLATVSPTNCHVEETLSTLRYAQQARYIINTARVNEDPKARLIRELRIEIEKLRGQCGAQDANVVEASLEEIEALRKKLAEREREMAEKERSWRDRLKKSERQRQEESRLLEQSGIAFKVDNTKPNLVNLNEDPQLSEMLLYMLKEGDTKVGREGARSDTDIQLYGPLIGDLHCIFHYDGKKVSIKPIADSLTYINGNQITEQTYLNHGDRVILGGDHYFRFSHSDDLNKAHRQQQGAPKDFEFARQELIRVQEARLQAELEQTRRMHQSELEELSRKEHEARCRMEEELRAQKLQYENQLSEKEKLLNDHRKRHYESDKHRQLAEEATRKLREQIIVLEQEVLANRKSLEMETKAAMDSMKVSRANHFGIVEQLEKETLRVENEVKQLVALRQQKKDARVITPRNTPGNTPRRSLTQDYSKKDFYKLMLKIQEANKISQHLNRHTVFSREDVIIDKKPETLIKVTRTNLNIATMWTIETFESRLLVMRELYELSYNDNTVCDGDDVFYDPNDTWEKDTKLSTPSGLSPRVLCGLRRQALYDGPIPLHLDSSSTPTSKSSQESSGQGTISTRTDSTNNMTSANFRDSDTLSVADLCGQHITELLNNYKDSDHEETAVDRMLSHSDVIHDRVSLLFDTYIKWKEQRSNNDAMLTFREMLQYEALVITTSIQSVLVSVSLWSHDLSQLESAHIHQLCEQLHTAVQKLANQLVLFLQGCENDLECMVKESSSSVFSAISLLCQLAGQIAIRTELPLLCLQESLDGSTAARNRNKIMLSGDIKRHILSGCGIYIDKFLSLAVHTLANCKDRINKFYKQKKSAASLSHKILRQLELVVTSCDLLIQRLKQTQMESLLSEMPNDCRCDNYHHKIYKSSQNLVADVTSLTDIICLMVDTSEALLTNKNDVSLQSVLKCANVLHDVMMKIIRAIPQSSWSADSQLSDDSLELSILKNSQLEQLEPIGRDVGRALDDLKAVLDSRSSGGQGRRRSSSGSIDVLQPDEDGHTGSIVKRNRAIFEQR